MSKKEKKNNNRLWFIIGGSVIGVVLIVSLVLTLFGCNSKIKLSNGEAVITKEKEFKVNYTKFDNGLVSLMVPEGWKVDIPPVDYIHYSLKVYNPDDPNYMFIFSLKLEGFLKSAKARETYKKLYPDAVFSLLPSIDGETTESFFKGWDEMAAYANKNNTKYEYFPKISEFKVVDKLGKGMFDSDILRGTFKNKDGVENEGIFNASVMSSGSYYINEDMFNLWSAKVDVAPLNVYNTIVIATPMGELDKWEGALTKCLNSIEFSQTFIDGFNREEKSVMDTFKANQKVYDEISDMIMDSWEKRNQSYDIISQKQIYKAYNGFTDDYSGDRYQPISDDMYTQGYSGYIEKVN